MRQPVIRKTKDLSSNLSRCSRSPMSVRLWVCVCLFVGGLPLWVAYCWRTGRVRLRRRAVSVHPRWWNRVSSAAGRRCRRWSSNWRGIPVPNRPGPPSIGIAHPFLVKTKLEKFISMFTVGTNSMNSSFNWKKDRIDSERDMYYSGLSNDSYQQLECYGNVVCSGLTLDTNCKNSIEMNVHSNYTTTLCTASTALIKVDKTNECGTRQKEWNRPLLHSIVSTVSRSRVLGLLSQNDSSNGRPKPWKAMSFHVSRRFPYSRWSTHTHTRQTNWLWTK